MKKVGTLLGEVEFRALEVALLLLLVLNGVTVFSRYVLNQAVGELFEVMIFVGVASYWLGAATAERLGGHLGMSFVVDALPAAAQRTARLLRGIVIVGFLAVVIWSGVKLTASQYRFGTNSGILDMPLWIFSAFLPFGAALLAWRTAFPPRKAPETSEAVL